MNETSIPDIQTTYLVEQNYIIQLYWFGENIPTINYIFLIFSCFYYSMKVLYLFYTKKSIMKYVTCGQWVDGDIRSPNKFGMCSEIKIVCITAGIINIIANILSMAVYPNYNEQVFLFIIVYGNYIVQLCDNSIFYFGYRALHKNTITNRFTYLCLSYTIIFMSLSWLPIYLILPYIESDSSSVFIQIYENNATNIYTYSNIAYNLFFTVEFTKIIYYYQHNEKNISLTTYIIAVKCIIHCFTSNFAILLLDYYDVNSVEISVIYIFILAISMNTLFNFSIIQKMDIVYRTVVSIIQPKQSNQSLQSVESLESDKYKQTKLSSQKSNIYDEIDDDIDSKIVQKLSVSLEIRSSSNKDKVYVVTDL
jgi:hypothetical protein